MSRIGQYWKAIAAAIGAAAAICVTLGLHDTVATVLVNAAIVLGVAAAPKNKPPAAPAASVAPPSNVTVVPPPPGGPRL